MTDAIQVSEVVEPGDDRANRPQSAAGTGGRRAARNRAAALWRGPFHLLSAVLVVFLALLVLYPLISVVRRLLTTNTIRRTLDTPNLLGLIGNTVVVVGISAILALVIGALLAWINEHTNARLGFITSAAPLVPFIIPPIASAVGWVLLFSPRAGLANALLRYLLGQVGVHLDEGPFNVYSMYGLILAYTVFQVPYVFLVLSAGLRNMDPALEEQSRVCRAGNFRTLYRVTLPALRPSIGGSVLLMVWSGFALFSVPAIIGTGSNIEVLSVRIVRLINFTFPPQRDVAVGLSGIIIFAVGTAWYLQTRVLRRGFHATVGGRGARGSLVDLGKWKTPARVFVVAYLLLTSVLPVVGLLLVAFNGLWTPNIEWSNLNLDAFRDVFFNNPDAKTSLTNSLWLGVIGSTIGIVSAAILTLFVQRSSRKVGLTVDACVRLPPAISGIVLAVGVILAFAGPPFRLYGTLTILLLAYIVHYLPQASVAADAAAGQVGKELPEASAVSGAGSGRTFLRVQLPIMAGGLAAGWALLFVRMTGDVNAAGLLSGPKNPVVGYQILIASDTGTYALVAALSIVLTATTAVAVVAVLLLTRRLTNWNRGSLSEIATG